MVLSFKLSKNWAFQSNEHSRILETTTTSAFLSKIHLLNSHWTKSTESHFQPFLNSKQTNPMVFLRSHNRCPVDSSISTGFSQQDFKEAATALSTWWWWPEKYSVLFWNYQIRCDKDVIYMYINWYSIYIYNIQLINNIHIHEVSKYYQVWGAIVLICQISMI